MESVKLVLPGMAKDYRKCDPTKQKEGGTYVEGRKLAKDQLFLSR